MRLGIRRRSGVGRRRRRVLRLGVLRNRLIGRFLGNAGLRLRRGWRRGGLVPVAEQPAEKAGGVGGLLADLLSLLQLLLQLGYLRPGLVERDVLHQHRLRKDIDRVRIGAQFVPEQILGIGVLFLKLGLIDFLGEGL